MQILWSSAGNFSYYLFVYHSERHSYEEENIKKSQFILSRDVLRMENCYLRRRVSSKSPESHKKSFDAIWKFSPISFFSWDHCLEICKGIFVFVLVTSSLPEFFILYRVDWKTICFSEFSFGHLHILAKKLSLKVTFNRFPCRRMGKSHHFLVTIRNSCL